MDKAQEIALQIGEFYLKKNNFDYAATKKEIETLRITNIEYTIIEQGSKTKGFADQEVRMVEVPLVTISTSRPGLLIGVRGKNIEDLAIHLKAQIKIIESTSWLDWLIPSELIDE